MIAKWYEVTCDYCGEVINHYIGRKPSIYELKADGAVCTATKQFCCSQCFKEWRREKHLQHEKKK